MPTPAGLQSPALPASSNDEIELYDWQRDVELAPLLAEPAIEESSGYAEQVWTPGSHPPNFIWIQIGLTAPQFPHQIPRS